MLQPQPCRIPLRVLLLVILVAAANLSFTGLFDRNEPETFADIQDHFKYGSIGAEERAGVPYWIWKVLPQLFPEYLPARPGKGYARFGFVYESETHARPIGTSFRERQVPLIGLNCAACHTGTLRESPSGPPRIILGMPAHQFDLQSYFRFLAACARDQRFKSENILAAIRKENPDFSWFDGLIYSFFVVSRTHDGIVQRAQELSWMERCPPQGPGRVDTFNPYKRLLGLDIGGDDTVGTTDLPSLWNQKMRQGLWLHWDGNNDLVEERNKSAAIGAGASEDSLDLPAMKRIEDWIWELRSPSFPTEKVHWPQVEDGKKLFEEHCASCHGIGRRKLGQVTPLNEVGTDPERLNSFTAALAERMNTLGSGRPWKFSHFRKTNGYANMPLDGVWLRAPYLHNGSVPTLRDLLKPPAERPEVFYRGNDLYDFVNGGFFSSEAETKPAGVKYDTRGRGNSNQGHDYGTHLKPAQKDALVEYLKTL
jgi:mono/diheme cytochrome c family protein